MAQADEIPLDFQCAICLTRSSDVFCAKCREWVRDSANEAHERDLGWDEGGEA